MFLGIESMSQEVLDHFNKCVTVELNADSTHALAEAGIDVIAGWIIGAPDQTLEGIEMDLRAFLELPLYAVNCTILSPDPATVEFVRARKAGRLGDNIVRGTQRSLRVVPDIAAYGSEQPAGLPTVCRAVTKRDLNRVQAAIDVHFYYREHVYARLTRGPSAAQRAVVDRYYRHIGDRLRAVDADDAPPAVQRLVELARTMTEEGEALLQGMTGGGVR